MKSILAYLFRTEVRDNPVSVVLLLIRIAFGTLLMTHGIMKINAFDAMSSSFADPFGIGSQASLCLAIFAEVLCAAAFILGFLYRLALIPMIVTMAVAFFFAHGGSLHDGELALAYMLLFVFMFVSGPGRCSADALIGRYFR